MQSTFSKILILLGGTLLLGLTVNQVYSEGIHWSLLLPENPQHTNPSISYISVDNALRYFQEDKAIFLDVRPEEEFQLDHIPGAISLPLFKFYKSLELRNTLNKQKIYIIYCFEAGCPDAASLASALAKTGSQHIMILHDGFSGWLERGYPIEK